MRAWGALLLGLGWLLSSVPVAAADPPPLFSEDGYRIAHYRRPLPEQPPAGQRIDTPSLASLIREQDPLLIDVLAITLRPETADFGVAWLPDRPREDIPGSVWLPNVGHGRLEPCLQHWFEDSLRRLSGGDRDRAMVFYCVTDCWMSWNAVKRAAALGYRKLFWYPEGSDGWREAGLPLEPRRPQALPGERESLFECPGSDLRRAAEKAADILNGGLMLLFETEHCPFCRRMRAGVLADTEIIARYRQSFVSLALDMLSDARLTDLDGSPTSARELASRYGVSRTPTLVFLDAQGEELYRHSGLIADPREFRALADYVAGGYADDRGFREFFRIWE